MKLLLIRHGKTKFNELGLIQGQYDSKLSDEGLESTKDFAKTFNREYDYCYSSPLIRARITAELITNNGNITYDDRIKEASFGVLEKTKLTKDKLMSYVSGKNIPKGAETRDDVVRRVQNFLKELKKKHEDSDTILIVTHGGVIRAIQEIYNNKSKEVKNLEIFEINI